MIYGVIWSPTSKITYYQILEYLQEKWTYREIVIFINRTEEALAHITQNPFLYPYSKENDTFKCVVLKQVSLFFRVKDEIVELLVFWDNRQDPARLLF